LTKSVSDQNRLLASREALEAWTRESRAAHETLNAAIVESKLECRAANESLVKTDYALSDRVSNLEGRMFAYAGAIGVFVTLIEVGLHFVKFGIAL
jgi:hypothetical protein